MRSLVAALVGGQALYWLGYSMGATGIVWGLVSGFLGGLAGIVIYEGMNRS